MYQNADSSSYFHKNWLRSYSDSADNKLKDYQETKPVAYSASTNLMNRMVPNFHLLAILNFAFKY